VDFLFLSPGSAEELPRRRGKIKHFWLLVFSATFLSQIARISLLMYIKVVARQSSHILGHSVEFDAWRYTQPRKNSEQSRNKRTRTRVFRFLWNNIHCLGWFQHVGARWTTLARMSDVTALIHYHPRRNSDQLSHRRQHQRRSAQRISLGNYTQPLAAPCRT